MAPLRFSHPQRPNMHRRLLCAARPPLASAAAAKALPLANAWAARLSTIPLGMARPNATHAAPPAKVTLRTLQRMYTRKEHIAVLTAYDFTMAKVRG